MALTLIEDNGSDKPDIRSFITTGLNTDAGYTFKVTPINGIGEGILLPASITAIAQARASAAQTTASGGALAMGITGSVREEQVVVFASDDCEADQMVLSIMDSPYTNNLCGSSALHFEEDLEKLMKTGDVHVTHNDITTLGGSQAFEYLSGGAPFMKTIIGLQKGAYYFVRVRAQNSQGYGVSQASTPRSLNPHQRSSPPTNVRVGIMSDTLLSVGWSSPTSDGVDGVTFYRVEWDTHEGFTLNSIPPHKGYIDVDASVNSSYTIELLSRVFTYYIHVSAINTAGVSVPQISSPSSVTLSKQVPGVPFSLWASRGKLSGQIVLEWR